MAALRSAVNAGNKFLDTTNVYGNGRSERLLARSKKEQREAIVIATTAGRRRPKQTAGGLISEALEGWRDHHVVAENEDGRARCVDGNRPAHFRFGVRDRSCR